ncbi:MAG TPA: PAS domain-containing protein [Limnobacter sp.]|nr:PAS domain-containing protein [Limnobacter sp.]
MTQEIPHITAQTLGVLECFPHPAWIFNPLTRKINWSNHAVCQLLDLTPETLAHKTIDELRPEEERAPLIQAINNFANKTTQTSVWTLIKANGGRLKASFHWQKCTFGDETCVLATITDLTEAQQIRSWQAKLQQQNDALKASSSLAEQNFQGLFEAVPGKFLVLRPHSHEIVAASNAYLQATMTNRSNILEHSIFSVFPNNPEDPHSNGVEILTASLRRVEQLKTTDVMGIQRYPIRRSDGVFEERHWSVVNAPVLDESNQLAYIIHRVEDVTDILLGTEQPPRVDEAFDANRVQELLLRINEMRQSLSRMQAQEVLLRSAERLLDTIAWEVDTHSGGIHWTTGNLSDRSIGLQLAAEADCMDVYMQLIHPDDRKLIAQEFTAGIRAGRRFTFEHRVIDKQGTIRLLKGTGESHQQMGRTIITGLLQDVSEIEEVKNKNTDLEQRLIATLENMGDAFYLLSNEFQFAYINPQAEILLRRKRVELIGKNVWDEFPEAIKSPLYSHYHEALRSGHAFKLRFYYPPLETWFEVNGYPNKDGLGVYFRDVTQEEKQRLTLQQLNERFELVSKATNDVIWDWDIEANTAWWNDSVERVFGHCVHTLEPGPESWSNRVHPEDVEKVVNSVQEIIDSQGAFWSMEYRFQKADGQYATVQDRGFVIRDNRGKAVRMLGSMQDLTEQRALEDRLREAQKLEAMGQLTGGVAHDFNNLLTVIMGNAETLSYKLSGDQQLRMMADMTAKAAERGAELTSRLLSFARRQPLRPVVLNANRLIHESQTLFRRTLPENIEIEIVEGAGLWNIAVDPGQLEGALLNLVINARDAMPKGGKLTIETCNARIDDNYAIQHDEVKAGQYIKLTVSDNGVGMDAETLKRAFEPFFTTKEVGKGSGLGLSMVFGFVKQSNGHIKIYSEPGHGTSVKLYFPRSKVDRNSEDATRQSEHIVGGQEHILVVEDDQLVREHLKGQLLDLGYKVSIANDGPSALEMLQRIPDVDLLLTDVIMPKGMNGRQLADHARGLRPGLKVLYTSGYTENAIVHHGRLDTDLELLSKPYQRRELAAKLRKVLDPK